MELGGSIELIGFSGQDNNDLVIVKKIVGNYAKHLAERLPGFSGLIISLKEVHRIKGEALYEVHGKVIHHQEEVDAMNKDPNLYFALDALLKQLTTRLDKALKQG